VKWKLVTLATSIALSGCVFGTVGVPETVVVDGIEDRISIFRAGKANGETNTDEGDYYVHIGSTAKICPGGPESCAIVVSEDPDYQSPGEAANGEAANGDEPFVCDGGPSCA